MSSSTSNAYHEAGSVLEEYRDKVGQIAYDLATRARWGEHGQVDGRDLVAFSNTLFDLSRDMTAEAGLMHHRGLEANELEETIQREADAYCARAEQEARR